MFACRGLAQKGQSLDVDGLICSVIDDLIQRQKDVRLSQFGTKGSNIGRRPIESSECPIRVLHIGQMSIVWLDTRKKYVCSWRFGTKGSNIGRRQIEGSKCLIKVLHIGQMSVAWLGKPFMMFIHYQCIVVYMCTFVYLFFNSFRNSSEPRSL
jgi:hypothetical protein